MHLGSGPVRQIALLSCFFNPTGSEVTVRNFRRFLTELGPAAEHLTVVECVFGSRPPQLDFFRNTHVVRSSSVLWHKERLLNLALERAAPSADVIAWLDGDVIFENRNWLRDLDAIFDDCDLAQPFEEICQEDDPNQNTRSYCASVARNPEVARGSFQDHGHTGYGWAIRADLLRDVGFFDRCIIGGADHVMAHALSQHGDVPCLEPLLGPVGAPLRKQHDVWAKRVLANAGRPIRIGYVPGKIVHMPHGSRDRRRYLQRNRLLTENGFDPDRDLEQNADGCWEWQARADKPRRLVEKYFAQRQEDLVLQ